MSDEHSVPEEVRKPTFVLRFRWPVPSETSHERGWSNDRGPLRAAGGRPAPNVDSLSANSDSHDGDAAVFDRDSVGAQIGVEGLGGVVEIVDANFPPCIERTAPCAVEWLADEEFVEHLVVEGGNVLCCGVWAGRHRKRRLRYEGVSRKWRQPTPIVSISSATVDSTTESVGADGVDGAVPSAHRPALASSNGSVVQGNTPVSVRKTSERCRFQNGSLKLLTNSAPSLADCGEPTISPGPSPSSGSVTSPDTRGSRYDDR